MLSKLIKLIRWITLSPEISPPMWLCFPTRMLLIINAVLGAVAITEVELGQIPMQMLLATMLIDATHPAFENRKIPFDGVGVDVTAHIFTCAVSYLLMLPEIASGMAVLSRLVGRDRAFNAGRQSLSNTVPNLLVIPPSVLSSCAIGFVLPAGRSHPIGASRSQRSGGGTVGWGSWIPCSTTRCECGWRFVASLTDATLRLAIVRTRPGRAVFLPSSPCRGFGAFLLQDGAGQQGGAGDGGAGYALLHL